MAVAGALVTGLLAALLYAVHGPAVADGYIAFLIVIWGWRS